MNLTVKCACCSKFGRDFGSPSTTVLGFLFLCKDSSLSLSSILGQFVRIVKRDSYRLLQSALIQYLRGNQRDRDRERAQARNGPKSKPKDDGLTPEQRRERDAKALQEKAARKAAQSATVGGGGGGEAGKKGNKK
ncbi:Uncharacterized protein family SERF [Macleaya cordata]|uniref:Uncharacterized protein family SERF n=1 Tax=Macleaya cordata TaxID=56857 RepID=A0A200PTS4_MACCD|nr:Uncharacterized protein family SERF [Macleaya cordata]